MENDANLSEEADALGISVEVLVEEKDNYTRALHVRSLIAHHIRDRELRGLKRNRITRYELREVLQHWLKNDRRLLVKSFRHVFETTGHENKEPTDWVKRIQESLGYGKELVKAFNDLKHVPEITLLIDSGVFNTRELEEPKKLSTRINNMDALITMVMANKELALDNKRLQAKLDAAEQTRPWKEVALELLDTGMTQRAVANSLDKSIITISRLVAANKKKESK